MKRNLTPAISTAASLILGWLLVAPTAFAEPDSEPRLTDERNTIEVVERTSGSVVAVRVSGIRSGRQRMRQNEQAPSGSGFVVDDQGRIITNFHVVATALADVEGGEIELAEGADISVTFAGTPSKEHGARIVGANPDVDLALLELDNPEAAPNAAPIPLGDSDQVVVGEKVIVIGNPFGLHSSVTTGVVSAVERERPGLVGLEIPYIQTDAAINPGNSGGPLLNSRGQVTGISNAVLSPIGTFAGVGLAVPVNLLRDNLEQLQAGGLSGVVSDVMQLPERARLGLQTGLRVQDYPPPVRERLNMPDHGVVVTEVAEGGPAARAGLREPQKMVAMGPFGFPVGVDVIVRAEGEPIERPIDLQQVVLEHNQGDEVSLEVWRGGETHQVDVELEVVPVSN